MIPDSMLTARQPPGYSPFSSSCGTFKNRSIGIKTFSSTLGQASIVLRLHTSIEYTG